MKKILPITFILLFVCVIVHAQDVGNAIGMNASPDLQQPRQDDITKHLLQQQDEQQVTGKRLYVAKQLGQIKQWYNSLTLFLTIKDGWHSAYATDYDLYISPCSLKVIDGKVAMIGKTKVSTSTIIDRGRCQITAVDTDMKMHTLNIYFIQ